MRIGNNTKHVIELVKKLDVARSADYSASAESFRQGLAEQTHSVVVNKLRNQVASPIVSEMMAPARAIFSESVKELYNNCCHYVSSKISKGDKSDKSSANDQGDAMARWRQEIDDVDSQKEHVMEAGAPISVVGSSGGDGSSRNTRAEQRTNHAASSTGHSEQRTSHSGLDPESKGQPTQAPGLGSTTLRVSAPAGRDSSSAGPRFVVVPGGARSADIDLFSFMGNNAGLSETPKLKLDSTFYTPSDLVIGDSSVGAPPAGHYIPSTSHPVLRASHLVPYTSHAGLDPVSRATAPYLTLPALDMTSLTPSLKPVQLYSASVSTQATVQSMSDQQLRSEYNSSVLNILLPECLLNDHQKQLRSEFDSRFKEQIGDAQKDSAGFILNAPLRFLVEKAADHDFGIGYSPEDTVFGSRMVGLEHFNQKDVVKKIEKFESVDIGFESTIAEIDSVGTELKLKLKPGGNKQAFDKKFEALQTLAEEGMLVKTKPGVRDRKIIEIYREEINMKIQQQWGERNPEFAARATERFGKYMDVDHIHELQLGGQDVRSNLQMLDQGVNRSFGAQVRHQLGKLPDGAKITKVTDVTKQVD